VTEEFIQRSSLSLGYLAFRFFPEKIEMARFSAFGHLTIPRIIKIDLRQLGEKLIFLLCVQSLHRVDYFGNRAHVKRIM
jgi:hypothetical protein